MFSFLMHTIRNEYSITLIIYRNIYPLDTYAKKGISNEVLIHYDTDDEDYLLTIKINVENSIERFNPNFIIYNAGTDCMAGDPLGSK